MDTYYIIYLSSATELLSEDDLIKLLAKSRKNNSGLGVTGMLIYIDGSFIQVLEGEEKIVEWTYRKIAADSRHRGIMKLKTGYWPNRKFPDWSMGFQMGTWRKYAQLIGKKSLNKNDIFAKLDNDDNHPAMILLESFYNSQPPYKLDML